MIIKHTKSVNPKAKLLTHIVLIINIISICFWLYLCQVAQVNEGRKTRTNTEKFMAEKNENTKISLAECRKTLNTNGLCYTDEEIVEIRDWLYHIVEIILEANEREQEKLKQTELNEQTTYKQAA